MEKNMKVVSTREPGRSQQSDAEETVLTNGVTAEVDSRAGNENEEGDSAMELEVANGRVDQLGEETRPPDVIGLEVTIPEEATMEEPPVTTGDNAGETKDDESKDEVPTRKRRREEESELEEEAQVEDNTAADADNEESEQEGEVVLREIHQTQTRRMVGLRRTPRPRPATLVCQQCCLRIPRNRRENRSRNCRRERRNRCGGRLGRRERRHGRRGGSGRDTRPRHRSEPTPRRMPQARGPATHWLDRAYLPR